MARRRSTTRRGEEFDFRRFHNELRERLRPFDFSSWLLGTHGVALKRTGGGEWRGPCPVHGGEGKTNFSVRKQHNGYSWRCYSGCGSEKGGDLVDLMLSLAGPGTSFPEAVRQACQVAGIDYDAERELAGGRRQRRGRPRPLRLNIKKASKMDRFADRHPRHLELIESLWGGLGMSEEGEAYLLGRGLSTQGDPLVKACSIEQWQAAIHALPHERCRETLLQMGLAKVTDAGKCVSWPSARQVQHMLVFGYGLRRGLDALRLRPIRGRGTIKNLSLPGSHNAPCGPWAPGPWVARRVEHSGVLFVTEGEIDALTLSQCGAASLGVPGANGWQRGWMEHLAALPGLHRLIVLADADSAGATLVSAIKRAALRELGIDWWPKFGRIERGVLGEKDANDALMAHGQAALEGQLMRWMQEEA